MACKNSPDLLQAYFDGELDLVRSLEIEQHLSTCPDCQREIRGQQATRDSLRAANLYARAPQSLKDRLRAALPDSAKPVAVIPPRRRYMLEWLALAAALFLAVIFGVRAIPNLGNRGETDALAQQIVAGHIRSLQPGHLFDVQSTDQHTVKPWFDGKLDFAPPVTDFAQAGYPLVGGRLDYMDGRPVAVLVYLRRLHDINVFIWPTTAPNDTTAASQTIQGYNIIHWTKSDMTFWAVSDLATDELQTLVTLLQK